MNTMRRIGGFVLCGALLLSTACGDGNSGKVVSSNVGAVPGLKADVSTTTSTAGRETTTTTSVRSTTTTKPVSTTTTRLVSTSTTQSSLSNDDYYTNVNGDLVHSPAHSSNGQIPAGASAKCRDGTYSFSRHRSGTCSGHGGVSRWL